MRLRIDQRAQAMVASLRHGLRHGVADGLEGENLALSLARQALGSGAAHVPGGGAGRQRLADRVKLVLASDLTRRWTLGEVARAVGHSAVYLTQVFQEVEGLPLYRYHLRLRLARALHLIPQYDDLTSLALDLGFRATATSPRCFPMCTAARRRRSNGRFGGTKDPGSGAPDRDALLAAYHGSRTQEDVMQESRRIIAAAALIAIAASTIAATPRDRDQARGECRGIAGARPADITLHLEDRAGLPRAARDEMRRGTTVLWQAVGVDVRIVARSLSRRSRHGRRAHPRRDRRWRRLHPRRPPGHGVDPIRRSTPSTSIDVYPSEVRALLDVFVLDDKPLSHPRPRVLQEHLMGRMLGRAVAHEDGPFFLCDRRPREIRPHAGDTSCGSVDWPAGPAVCRRRTAVGGVRPASVIEFAFSLPSVRPSSSFSGRTN